MESLNEKRTAEMLKKKQATSALEGVEEQRKWEETDSLSLASAEDLLDPEEYEDEEEEQKKEEQKEEDEDEEEEEEAVEEKQEHEYEYEDEEDEDEYEDEDEDEEEKEEHEYEDEEEDDEDEYEDEDEDEEEAVEEKEEHEYEYEDDEEKMIVGHCGRLSSYSSSLRLTPTQQRTLRRMGKWFDKAEREIDFDFGFGFELLDVVRSTNQMVRNLPRQVRLKLDDRKRLLVERARGMWVKMQNAKMKRMLHKLCFVASFLNVIVTACFLGANPSSYYVCHTFKLVFLVSLRAVLYRLQRQHYYLFDFCYFANIVLLFSIYYQPDHEGLRRTCAVFAGTLGNSVVLFRNSLVPHSLDRITSAEIHFSPLLVTYTMRWFSSTEAQRKMFPGMTDLPLSFSSWFKNLREMVPYAFTVYATWAVAYYLKLFFFSASKIKKKGYATLYQHMAQDKGILYTLPNRFQQHGRLVFAVAHLGIFAFGALYIPVLFHNFLLHTIWLISLLVVIIYNGGQFYIDYFAKHYESSLAVIEDFQQEKDSRAAAAAADEGDDYDKKKNEYE